jgi:hypothetical protein
MLLTVYISITSGVMYVLWTVGSPARANQLPDLLRNYVVQQVSDSPVAHLPALQLRA